MEVAILVGLPASGKTTFFRERLAATHAHVSKDLMPNVRARGERQRQEIERALAAGRSVAVDNTNPRRSDRAPILAQARAHGARTVGYYFATTPRDCLARNAGREGRARVPPVAVFLAARRMERPARDEGFDALYEVRPIAPAGFDLRPLDTSSGDEEPPPAARSVYPRKVAPESWLSGPVEGVSPYLMPAAHALLQAREDLARAAEG
jgi:predicted kinase